MHDLIMRADLERIPHVSVPWCLMASYSYYCLDRPLLTDATYDWLCLTMARHWPVIQHRHKHLIGQDDLLAGSLYRLTAEDYPTITRDTALYLLEHPQ